MARLSGRFAGVVGVQVEESQASKLEQDLIALESESLELRIETVDEGGPAPDTHSANLTLVGQDRPGILKEITAALAAQSVDVVQLETGCRSAAMSGEILFEASASLICPTSVSIEGLRETLELIGNDLMVDISLMDSGQED